MDSLGSHIWGVEEQSCLEVPGPYLAGHFCQMSFGCLCAVPWRKARRGLPAVPSLPGQKCCAGDPGRGLGQGRVVAPTPWASGRFQPWAALASAQAPGSGKVCSLGFPFLSRDHKCPIVAGMRPTDKSKTHRQDDYLLQVYTFSLFSNPLFFVESRPTN